MRAKAQIICCVAAALIVAATTQPANLVRNGDFEKADSTNVTLPDGWITKHPDNVRYVKDAADPKTHGMIVQMTGDKGLMGTYGVDLFSDKILFKPNTKYLLSGSTRSAGPNMIAFIKGYETLNGKEEQVYQMRKEIAATKTWQPFELNFDLRPTKEFSQFQQKIEYLRIELWAYWPAGTCWFDDIRFVELGPADPNLKTNDEAVTHVGVKPHLATTQADEFDAEQTWDDAVNAFNAGQDEDSLKLVTELLSRDAENSDYRLLDARLLARQEKLDQADAQATWLIDHAGKPWQRDWAKIVHAQAIWKKGGTSSAKQLLDEVIQQTQSENAKQAANDLLKKINTK